ncbi:MAG TPA: hypothetical protein VH092_11445 [Urbifossiella sp.]|nr:hypothetical protein [Urbifossiella sp.]
MPIPVVCDTCQTRLNAPDAAAGRKVKCPKCQAVIPVPAAAGPPAPAAPPTAPPPAGGGAGFDFGAATASAEPRGRGDRPRRPRDRDDDAPPDRGDRPRRPRPRDDDPDAPPPGEDEGGDRPRGRGGRPGGPKKKSPVLLIALAGGFILLTCCGAVGYYALGRIKTAAEEAKARNDALEKQINDEKKKRAEGGGGDPAGGGNTADGGKAAVPAGWKTFTPPDGSFKAYFPATPKEDSAPPKKGVLVMKTFMCEGPDDEYTYIAVVAKFAPTYPVNERTKFMKEIADKFGGNTPGAAAKDVTWLGQKGKEFVAREPGGTSEIVVRYTIVGNTGYLGGAENKAGRKPALMNGFLDNFEATPR